MQQWNSLLLIRKLVTCVFLILNSLLFLEGFIQVLYLSFLIVTCQMITLDHH